MSARVDSLRNTLDHLALDPRASDDRRYLVSMLRRLGYSDAEIEAQIGPLGGEEGRVIEVEYEGPVGDRTPRALSRETTFQVGAPDEGLSFRLADDDAPAGAGVDEVYASDISGVESDLGDWGDFEQGARSDFTSVDGDAPDDFDGASDDRYGDDGFSVQPADDEVVEFRAARRPDPAVAAGWQEEDSWGGATDATEDAPWGEESDELAWSPPETEADTAWPETEEPAQEEQAWPETDAEPVDEQAWPEPEADTLQEPEQAWPEPETDAPWPQEETPEAADDDSWDAPAEATSEPELVPWPEEEVSEEPADAVWEDAAATEQVEPEAAPAADTTWQDAEAEEPAWIEDVAADAPYTHGDYTLYTREVHLSTGREQRIYFFAKNTPQSGHPCPLPDGYEVIENEKTGLPFLRRQR